MKMEKAKFEMFPYFNRLQLANHDGISCYQSAGKISDLTVPHTERNKDNNIAIVTGVWSNNLNVFDIDVRGDQGVSMAYDIYWMLGGHGGLSSTPSGGFHVWFSSEEPLKTCRINWGCRVNRDVVHLYGDGLYERTYYTNLTLFANSASKKYQSYAIWPDGKDYVWLKKSPLYAVPNQAVMRVIDKYEKYDTDLEHDSNLECEDGYTPNWWPEWCFFDGEPHPNRPTGLSSL